MSGLIITVTPDPTSEEYDITGNSSNESVITGTPDPTPEKEYEITGTPSEEPVIAEKSSLHCTPNERIEFLTPPSLLQERKKITSEFDYPDGGEEEGQKSMKARY